MTDRSRAPSSTAQDGRDQSSSARALVRAGQPLYRQLAADLRRRILSEEFTVGQPIPTEAGLSRDYRASRITVRHALGLLEQEGLLHREQGRGSFIRRRAIAVGPRRLTSFSEEIQERGGRASSDVISIDTVDAPVDIPIDIGPDGRCLRIERVRRADDQALAHQVTFIPTEFGTGIEEALAVSGSLYRYLRVRHALDIDSADETYRVAAASSDEAAILDISERSPVFVVERVGFAGSRRVEWTLSTVAGEGYEVHIHLRR